MVSTWCQHHKALSTSCQHPMLTMLTNCNQLIYNKLQGFFWPFFESQK